jgi:acyl carrier protein
MTVRPAPPPLDDAALAAMIRRELCDIRPGKLTADWPDTAAFIEELGIDSLDLVELVSRLEQSSGIYIPDQDIKLLTSVAMTAAYIRARRASDE